MLPDETYDRYDVLNPRQIWLMVVLIVAISLGGYIVFKWLGSQAGTVLAGVLGGLISSTATTVSYARRTREPRASIRLAALVLIIASAVSVARVLAEIAIVAPSSFLYLAPPLAIQLAWLALLALGTYFTARGIDEKSPPSGNPAELKSALVFGGLYAVVLFAVAAAKELLGDSGLYAVAVLSGLHDLDAITLSTAHLVNQGQVNPDTGGRLILVATLSNLAFKGCLVTILGHRRLVGWMTVLFGAALVGGLLVLLGLHLF